MEEHVALDRHPQCPDWHSCLIRMDTLYSIQDSVSSSAEGFPGTQVLGVAIDPRWIIDPFRKVDVWSDQFGWQSM